MTSSASSTSVGACSSHRAGFVVNVVVVVEFVVVVLLSYTIIVMGYVSYL